MKNKKKFNHFSFDRYYLQTRLKKWGFYVLTLVKKIYNRVLLLPRPYQVGLFLVVLSLFFLTFNHRNQVAKKLITPFRQFPQLVELRSNNFAERYIYNAEGDLELIEALHLDAQQKIHNLKLKFIYQENQVVAGRVLANDTLIQWLQFGYDEDGIFKRLEIFGGPKKDKRLFDYVFFYDKEDRIIKRVNQLNKEREDYEYDDQDHIKRLYFYDLTGTLNYYSLFEYDDKIKVMEQPGIPVYVSLSESSYRPHLRQAPQKVHMFVQGIGGKHEPATSNIYQNQADKNGYLGIREVSSGLSQQRSLQVYKYK
jgi:hypothetical protein